MRRSRRTRTSKSAYKQLGWGQPSTRFEHIGLLSDDEIQSIHEASLLILRDVGMRVLSDRALRLMKDAGAKVDFGTQNVRFEPELIEALLLSVPSSFTLHARNPARNLHIGGNRLAFSTSATPAYCTDLKRGRRTGNVDDYRDLIRLGHMLNTVHFFYGYPVEPQDLPVETRHLDCYRDQIKLSDKAWRCYGLTADCVLDAIEMVMIARARTREQLKDEPSIMLNCPTNSPLLLDGAMAEGAIEMAKMGQPVVITSFAMAGAMAPVTIAGAVVQQNAECLLGIALTQIARKGAPAVYGSFASSVNMRSGDVALGTPEFAKAAVISGQLARRYGIPLRSNNVNSSNVVDAQSAYESACSIWSTVASGGNIIAQGVGWLEAGLTCSFEKMIVDAEMLQMVQSFLEPLDTDPVSLATKSIAAVGPGGHFFDEAMTVERYRTAFYEPLLSDWRPIGPWQDDGGKTATERSTAIWEAMLQDYEEPALPEDVSEELSVFVERRRQEISERGAA